MSPPWGHWPGQMREKERKEACLVAVCHAGLLLANCTGSCGVPLPLSLAQDCSVHNHSYSLGRAARDGLFYGLPKHGVSFHVFQTSGMDVFQKQPTVSRPRVV